VLDKETGAENSKETQYDVKAWLSNQRNEKFEGSDNSMLMPGTI